MSGEGVSASLWWLYSSAKMVLPGGATSKEGEKGGVSQGFITPSHRWSPQQLVVAGVLQECKKWMKQVVFIKRNVEGSSHRGEKSQPTTVKKIRN